MDDAAKKRFAFFLEMMNNAMSHFELAEARREAELIARDHGMSFDRALREHRAGWPADDEESTQISSKTTSLPASPVGDDVQGAAGVGEVETPPNDHDEAATDASAHLSSSDDGEASLDVAEVDETVQSRSSDDAEASAEDLDHQSADATARDAIAAALVADPSRSDRDIARETGSSPTTVGRARAAVGLERLVRSVKRGGKSYDMDTGRRGPQGTV